MFDRYTEEARRVIFYGRLEASEFGSNAIESDHLLLGLLKEDIGLAGRLFPASGLRSRVEQKLTPAAKTPTDVDLPLSLAAQQVLARASEEAERLNDYHIAPAHLLLGLLRDEESLASEILKEHGVGIEEVRRHLLSAKPSPDAGMMQILSGFWVSRAVYTAATLGLADLVKDGPKPVAELAAASGSDPRSLRRMLRALASVGVFVDAGEGKYGTSPLAQTLEEGRPGSLRYFAMAELGQEHYSAWEEFPNSVVSGKLAFTEKYGQSPWEYYAAHPEHAEVFNRSMSSLTEGVTQAVISAYDFSPFHKIVDIGGGQGAFLAAILSAAPQAQGVLFDSPPVIPGAHRLKGHQAQAVGGDFFEAVPDGGDLYTLKWILHDWTDEQCVTILKNIHKAIVPGGKILIVEAVLGDGPDAAFKNFLDLNMMVMTGGCERTAAEYQALLERAGFKFLRLIPTQSPMGIIEGVAD